MGEAGKPDSAMLKRLLGTIGLLGLFRMVGARRGGDGDAGSEVTVAGPAAAMATRSDDGSPALVVAKDVLRRFKNDDVATRAAALAYYAMLSVFPGLIALVTFYGLFADPSDVQRLVDSLPVGVPESVATLIDEQLNAIVTAPTAGLSFGAILSSLAVLWSASNGTKALVRAINVIHDESEKRNAVKLRGFAVLVTLGLLVGAGITIAALTFVPAWLGSVSGVLGTLASVGRWPLLAVLLMFGLALLYRFAPARKPPRWRWASWGAAIATALWLVVSAGFAYYASNFGSFNETYGAIGGVIVMLLWFFLSALVILLGAEINESVDANRGV